MGSSPIGDTSYVSRAILLFFYLLNIIILLFNFNSRGVVMNPEKIGKVIKDIRKQNNLSQQQFTSLNGKKYSFFRLSNISLGKNN